MINKRFFPTSNYILLLLLACTTPEMKTATTESALAPLPQKHLTVSLTWKSNIPEDEFDLQPLSVYQSISVSIAAFEDIRSDPRIIGKTLEDKKVQNVYMPVVTNKNVSKWCKNGIITSLRDLHIPTAGKKGTLLLEFELTECSINDNITQTGIVGLRVAAYTRNELLIWEGNIQGTSDLYYRPKNSDGISECLSNTLKVTTHNLFTEQSFRDAVIKAFELQ